MAKFVLIWFLKFLGKEVSNTVRYVICGLSLLVLSSAPRGFSPGTPVFLSPQKPTFDLICIIC